VAPNVASLETVAGFGEIADGAEHREHTAPARAPDRELSIRGVEPGGELAIAIDEEGIEPEDLDFLRRLDARAGLPNVVELGGGACRTATRA